MPGILLLSRYQCTPKTSFPSVLLHYAHYRKDSKLKDRLSPSRVISILERWTRRFLSLPNETPGTTDWETLLFYPFIVLSFLKTLFTICYGTLLDWVLHSLHCLRYQGGCLYCFYIGLDTYHTVITLTIIHC
jgi:hypothetical protein